MRRQRRQPAWSRQTRAASRCARRSGASTCCDANGTRRRNGPMPKYVATLDGADHQLEVEELSAHALRVKIGERQFEVDVHRAGHSSYSILIDNRSFDLEVGREGEELVVASRGGAARVTLVDAARRSRHPGTRPAAAGKAALKAMMPGR